jgi:hypothetical protein
MPLTWRQIAFILSGFYIYAVLSNPHLFISLTRKNFRNYKFELGKIVKQGHTKPVPLPSVFLIIASLREIYLIFLRFHWIEKIFRRRKANYDQNYRIIVNKRFNPSSPYLIAGDHFSSFYPRNLGFFYAKALNPKTTLSLSDYKNRLITYLNSLSFSLEFFEKIDLTTTVVPIYGRFFCAGNIYSKPADTLCSLLLAFDYLINYKEYNFNPSKVLPTIQEIEEKKVTLDQVLQIIKDYDDCYESTKISKTQISAAKISQNLLLEFKQNLRKKVFRHIKFFDPETGLINKKYSLSGIRDGTFRSSSFYENVVAWKTLDLALKFDLLKKEDLPEYLYLENLKTNIIKNFYKNNILYNELDEQPELYENLSADFLVAFSVGFLDPYKKEEREILKNQVKAFYKANLVLDFGILYSQKNPKRLAKMVRLFVKDYMGRTVWSHWTVEFLQLLISLYEVENNKEYLKKAEIIYKNLYQKLLEYKGYPELYNQKGGIYKTIFYVSMIDTGWIVNFQDLKLRLEEKL